MIRRDCSSSQRCMRSSACGSCNWARAHSSTHGAGCHCSSPLSVTHARTHTHTHTHEWQSKEIISDHPLQLSLSISVAGGMTRLLQERQFGNRCHPHCYVDIRYNTPKESSPMLLTAEITSNLHMSPNKQSCNLLQASSRKCSFFKVD